MSDDAGLDELARRYLDFWQDQVSALAGDEEMAAAMSRLLTTMGPAAAGAAQPWLAWPMAGTWPGAAQQAPRAREASADDGRQGSVGEGVAGPTGTAAAAAASGDRLLDLDELARRLGALEERVAALEGAAGRGKRASGGARKRRS